MDYGKLSKEISYALRHAPWEFGLELDKEGFVPIDRLLRAINDEGRYGRNITKADLERMIEVSEKRRHEIVGDKIRALYGHSVEQKIRKAQAKPPDILYHGTTHVALPQILEGGLKPMQRQYVHLSIDVQTAISVGARRDSDPVILRVDAASANAADIAFYRGNDKVWLTDTVPAKYLSVVKLLSGKDGEPAAGA